MGWIVAAFTGGFFIGGIIFGAVGCAAGYRSAVNALARLGALALNSASVQNVSKGPNSQFTGGREVC